ncbi:MAG: hypothetical protein VB878_08295, partial [Pirellulaceae bacterium]
MKAEEGGQSENEERRRRGFNAKISTYSRGFLFPFALECLRPAVRLLGLPLPGLPLPLPLPVLGLPLLGLPLLGLPLLGLPLLGLPLLGLPLLG